MHKPRKGGKLKRIEKERGIPLDTLIPDLIKQEGSIAGAASKLNVSRFTLLYWLEQNNYRTEIVTQVVKDNDPLRNSRL